MQLLHWLRAVHLFTAIKICFQLQVAQMIGQELVKKVLELFTNELNRFAHEYRSKCQRFHALLAIRSLRDTACYPSQQTESYCSDRLFLSFTFINECLLLFQVVKTLT